MEWVYFMKKLSKSGIFILMTVIILLQYISPILAAADTLDDKNDLITLNSAKVSKEDDQTVTINLKVTADNATEQAKKTQIELSNKAIVFKEALNQLTTSKNQYKLNGQVLEATIAPNTSKEENELTIKLDKASLKGIDTVQVSSGDSKTTLDLSGVTQLAEKSIESSTPASSTSSSSTKDEAIKEATKETKSTTSKLRDVVPTPTDIGPLLPDEFKGSIFDNINLIFKDNSGKDVTADNFKADGTIDFQYAWSLPNRLNDDYQLKDGDYYTFSLPKNIGYRIGTGSLGDYGDYEIRSDGTVKFTFKNIGSVENIKGTFFYKQSTIVTDQPGQTTIDIPTKDGNYKADIVIKPSGGEDIAKAGSLNKDNHNPSQIFWDVTINTNGNHLKNAIVSDAFPEGNTYSSVIVKPLVLDMKGDVISEGTPLSPDVDYTVDASGTVKFIGKYADTYQAFRVSYTTNINENKKPNDGGQVIFDNKATLTNGDKVTRAGAEVTANYGSLLSKTYDGIDQAGSQVFNWHIDYNAGEKLLPAGASIVDSLDGDQVFYKEPVLTGNDNQPIDTSLYNISYSDDHKTMTVTFPKGIDKQVKIAYQSQVTVPIGDDGKTILTNKVKSGDTETDANSGEVRSQGLYKSIANDGIDYTNRTVTWNLDINPARQIMKNWSLDEKVPNGLTVDKSSIGFINRDTNTALVLGTDYTISYNPTGFHVEFIGALKDKASDWYLLTLKTNFDTNKLGEDRTWTNTAVMNWTDKFDKEHENTGTADFEPRDDYYSDGSKDGSYNAVTKAITWNIYTNLNQRKLVGASITDVLAGDQEFVAGTAKLYSGDINKEGNIVNLVEVKDVTPSFDEKTRTVSVKLPEGSTAAYVLSFNTSLKDKVIDKDTYKNTAIYTNNKKDSSLNGYVSVNNGGNIAEKTGEQDKTDSAYALWHVMVNKSQSTLKDVTITDKPSSNQIIVPESIMIYGTHVDESGNVTVDTSKVLTKDKDYSVELKTDSDTGKQTLVVQFLKQIDASYSLEYRTLINSSLDKDTLTNDVNITGKGQKVITSNVEGSTVVINNGGSSEATNINLVLSKVDKDDNSKILAGVKFELYASIKNEKGSLLRSGTTDKKGQIKWGNLKSGDYYLVETSTITGYEIPSDLAVGKKITVMANQADADNNVHITEQNEKSKISVKGSKIWDDNNNVEGLRPETIKVNLLIDKKVVKTLELSQATGWNFNFNNLDKFDKDGNVIKYSVSEDAVANYSSSINQTDLSNVKVTNLRTLELIQVKGTKTWHDNDNQDGIRPDKITVNLLADGKQVATQEVTSEKDWKYSFASLPKFAAGKAVVYTISEANVTGYDVTVKGNDLINTHAPELTAVIGTKTWSDNDNQDGIRPVKITVNLLADGKVVASQDVTAKDDWEYSFANLPKFAAGKVIVYTISEATVAGYDVTVKGSDLTNTHAPELIAVNGTKTWSDNDNQDGIRPAKITANLLADGKQVATKEVTAKDDWKYSFANLPKFAAGKAIVYTVSEAKVAGYDVTVKGNDLINTHAPELTAVSGTKTWSDNDNQDGIRPAKITVNLLADGKVVATQDVTVKDDWEYSFANLPKFAAGKVIVYTISEVTVAGYDVTVKGSDLTNTHTPELIAVSGTKTWHDNDNQDGIRPDKINVNLLADGKQIATQEVTAEKDWKYSFASLPKFAAGKAVVYTISEANVTGYDVTVNGSDLINTHAPETTVVSGTKSWDDNDNQDGIRPAKITVNLLADGKVVSTQDVTAKDDWKYSFANLPKFAAGKVIVYTISEATVAGYDTAVNGYDLTNTHTPVTPTTPNQAKGNDLPKTSEIINHLYYLIGFVMLTLAGFGLVLAKKGKL